MSAAPPKWSKSRCVSTTASTSSTRQYGASASSRLLFAPSQRPSRPPAAVSTSTVPPEPCSTRTFETTSMSPSSPRGAIRPSRIGRLPAVTRWTAQSDIERHLVLAAAPHGHRERGRLAHLGEDRTLGAGGDHRLGHPVDPHLRPPPVATVVALDRLERVDAVRAHELAVAQEHHRRSGGRHCSASTSRSAFAT